MRNALLWQLFYPDGKESLLFGTMHVRDKSAYRFVDTIKEKILLCNCYYGEIDLNEAGLSIKPEDYMMPSGVSLRELLPKRKYERMQKYLEKIIGIQLENFDMLLPLITINKIAESILTEDEALSLDHYLWLFAEQHSKACGGIESVEEQLELIKSINIDLQLRMLVKLCKNLSSYRKQVNTLKNYYENQQIHQLYKVTRSSLGKLKHDLLKKRNIKMARRIADIDLDKNFFTVGAAHLAGYYGLIRLLRQDGIKCKAINLNI
jgi:uncharacterized protein YbaP (TraB family)